MSKSANKILHTAERLFNQQSFVAVGVDLIRDQSGCSKTTMYTYFNNKQQLIEQVLEQRDQRFRQSLNTALSDRTGIDALEMIYEWHMQWFQDSDFKGCLFIRALAESMQEDHRIGSITHAHKKWLQQIIEQQCINFKAKDKISDLCFLMLEGLISRFLVENFNPEIANLTKTTLFDCIQFLEQQ